jgi:VWFA-related protein
VFRSATQTVPVYVTVIGLDGHLVTDLGRDAFTVRDNGRPQPISLFEAGEQPITITVMLDTSGSMVGNLPLLRSAAVQLFTRLEPDDRARVGHFGDRISIGSTFTNDVDTLIRALWLDIEPGGPTPLWGGVMAAMASMSGVEGRRVVLVFSDGHNTGLRTYGGRPSGPSLADVIRRAQTEDFMVYAIGMRSRSRPAGQRGQAGRGGLAPLPGRGFRGAQSEPDPGLAELAAESGGGYFELDDAAALGPAFARVADELHHQYLLGFVAPEADGQQHLLDVEVHDVSMRPRARRSYQAPRPALVP